MMLVVGPAFSGKRAWVCQTLGWSDDQLSARAVVDAQDLVWEATDLEMLADELASYEVVVACEVGSGVVPVEANVRAWREAAGRLSCLLAERADVVVRICCGLPQVLKGSLAKVEDGRESGNGVGRAHGVGLPPACENGEARARENEAGRARGIGQSPALGNGATSA